MTSRSPGGRRSAAGRAERLPDRGDGPGAAPRTVWDSARWRRPDRPSWPTAGRHWPPTPATGGRWRRRRRRPVESVLAPRRLHHRDCDGDWRRCGCGPGPADPGRSGTPTCGRTRPCPTGRSSGPPPSWPPPTSTSCGSTGPRSTPVRASATPTSSTTRPPTSPGLSPGRTNAIGVLHHWYGPGQGRPASAPGLLVQLSVHYTDGTRVVIGSDGTWRTRRPSGCPPRSATPTAATSSRTSTAGATPMGWADAGLRRRRLVTPAAVLGPVGTAPFTHLFALRTRIVEHPVARCRCGPCPPARWWSTSARSTPPAAGDLPPRGRRAHGAHARRAISSTPTARLDHPQHPGHRPVLLLHPARRSPDLRALLLPRVPLPPDRRSR